MNILVIASRVPFPLEKGDKLRLYHQLKHLSSKHTLTLDEGFSAPEMKGKHSLKASVTSELVFLDCKIPKDRILPGVKGLRGPFSCINNARFGISWGALGAAMACFHSAKTYALSRIQFDHPIASYQLVQNKLAWMLREITKGQLLAYHLGRKKDDGTWFNEQISLAKMNNVVK